METDAEWKVLPVPSTETSPNTKQVRIRVDLPRTPSDSDDASDDDAAAQDQVQTAHVVAVGLNSSEDSVRAHQRNRKGASPFPGSSRRVVSVICTEVLSYSCVLTEF